MAIASIMQGLKVTKRLSNNKRNITGTSKKCLCAQLCAVSLGPRLSPSLAFLELLADVLSTLYFSLGDNYTEFKGLSPEEAQTKLIQLIKDEIDQNKDGYLTEDEIRARFHVTTKEYRRKEVMETMKQHDEGQRLRSVATVIDVISGVERSMEKYLQIRTEKR